MPITSQYYMMPLRDGVKLATLAVRPDENGAFPFIVIRSPYGGANGGLDVYTKEFCENGLGFILQEVRGTGLSEGDAEYWLQEKQDAEDFLNWISQQKWFNGRLVTNGESYPGSTQWQAARNAHPVMVGLTPHNAPLNIYECGYYSSGAYAMGLGCMWAIGMRAARLKKKPLHDWKDGKFFLPFRDMDEYMLGEKWDLWKTWSDHPEYDDYWKRGNAFSDMSKITAPAFITGGWFDTFLQQTLRAFTEIRKNGASFEARNYSRMVIEPLDHDMKTGDADYGPNHLDGIIATRNRFMKNILLHPGEDPLPDKAPVKFFVMGSNTWMEANEWPLSNTADTPFYLRKTDQPSNTAHGGGLISVNAADASAENTCDHFIYDPLNPVPTHGGNNLGYITPGQRNQAEIETRSDVLVYTGEPLNEDLTVIGYVKAVLYAATDAPDTDWTVKLCDVYPDGTSYNVCDGIIRARYKDGAEKAELLPAGSVNCFEIDCWATAMVFKKGHRLRVQVSSSNFPRYDRNPNTGAKFGVNADTRPAFQTIYTDAEHPSRMILPVLK